MEQKSLLITKETTIGEIVERHPEVVETLTSFGVHCVGCHVSPFESLENGFKGHGMTDEDVEKAVMELNNVIKKNGHHKHAKKEDFDLSKATLNLTDNAAKKLKELLKQEKKQALRISVMPGGCSGHQYGMELDDKATEEDIVITQKGVKIFVDKASIMMLNNSNVDFIDSLQGAGFKISNPGAKSTCGCGNSFG